MNRAVAWSETSAVCQTPGALMAYSPAPSYTPRLRAAILTGRTPTEGSGSIICDGPHEHA